MDYLVTHGYPLAAQKFAAEANLVSVPNVETIDRRVEIREAIHSGHMQLAIEQINELNPQVPIPITAEATPKCCHDVIYVHAPLIVFGL